MQGKITLITPPDIYENSNESILFMHLTDDEQDRVSKWLGKTTLKDNINIYLYTGEPNVHWLMYSLSCSGYKYINIDCVNNITQALSGYILSKSNTYFKTTNEDLANIYGYVNANRTENIEDFLEGIFSGQPQDPNEPLV